jgi:uncharacterized protein (DUF2267 family)
MIRINRAMPSKREPNVFDETVANSKVWLKEVQKEVGAGNQRQAYAALHAVLHTLRDRLTVAEAVDLGAQLPVLIRGVYYDGWIPNGKPEKISNARDFVDRVSEELGQSSGGHPLNALVVTEGVIKVLEQKISQGEIDDIKATLPHDMLKLWSQSRPEEELPGPAGDDSVEKEEEDALGNWREDEPMPIGSDQPGNAIAWDEPEEI